MDGDTFNLRWEDEERRTTSDVVACEEVIYSTQSTSCAPLASDVIKQDTDQMAAENLMYLSQDVVIYSEATELDDGGVECVTEEVITDDWVVPGGQERVEVPIDQLTQPLLDLKEENDIDVPLPTDQDEYTAMRPWPCDFCSRRFRKKAALMNHMVAHQNDRPHACNLCGVRYVRKSDLMNHLKVHAYVPENEEVDYDDVLENHQLSKPKKKRGRRKKIPEPVVEEENSEVWENMTSARTQQWSRKRAGPAPALPSPPPPQLSPPPAPPSPPPPVTDPSRPFVCKHCHLGFAREKALQSHSRVHGGESPLECGVCGELCWSREALEAHSRRRHPHRPAHAAHHHHRYDNHHEEEDADDDDDMEFRLSPTQESDRPVYDTVRGPELFCQHCGVAFQRADLLRRHVTAAHSYKRHDSSGGGEVGDGGEGSDAHWTEHTCSVCGETCSDALSLLAHAELHTERGQTSHRFKNRNKTRNTSSSSGRSFPCRECGKVFGSRSSQQIHIRIHTGERPYACRFCWKAFADGGTLRKHERIHTGEKPYACAVCPRAFNQRVVLREHVRSHHSAPDRRSNGGPSYCCVVCGRTLHSSTELVQHLIEHCDANTALKRKPQSGPRKYKRRKKLKECVVKRDVSSSPPRDVWSPPPGAGPPDPQPAPPRPPAPRRRRRVATPPPRPRMIHTMPNTRPVRTRRPPRHPADDLLVIRTHLPTRSPPPAPPSPSLSPSPSPTPSPSPPASPPARPKVEPKIEVEVSSSGAYRCEMCDLRFDRRDALLLHVPVHI